jgi:hypothetical protein
MSASCERSTEPVVPASVEFAGNAQTGVAGAALPAPVVLTVHDASGNAVPGAKLDLIVVAGGGSLSSDSETTDAQGKISVIWTLGPVAGQNQVFEVRIPGSGIALGQATATAITGPAASIVFETAPQSGPVGSVFPVPLTIRVTDAVGNPVPNAAVQWMGAPGTTLYGAFLNNPASTDADGRASSLFAAGSASGTFNVIAMVGNVASASLPLTLLPLAPAKMVKAAPDNQSASPGSAVAAPPAVKVLDRFNNPVGGVEVTFSVTGGGGTVTNPVAVTNAVGVATAGTWTLGAQPAVNVVRARHLGLATEDFTAVGINASSALSVTVSGSLCSATEVCATVRVVSSQFSIASITAAIGSVAIPLAVESPGVLVGRATVGTLPPGTHSIVATVTDVQGNKATAVSAITVVQPISLHVIEPADFSVVGSQLTVRASCTAGGAATPCVVTVHKRTNVFGTLLAQPSPVNATVSLAAYPDEEMVLEITARDDDGRGDGTYRTVFSPNTGSISMVASASGLARDYDGTTVLYQRLPATDSRFGPPCCQSWLGLHEIASGIERESPALPIAASHPAHLYGLVGAVVAPKTPGAAPTLFKWDGTTLTQRQLGIFFAFAGRYMLYRTGGAYLRHDLETGAEVQLPIPYGVGEVGLAANGDVVYVDGLFTNSTALFRWRNGDSVRIYTGRPRNPITDGTNVVFSEALASLKLVSASGVEELSPAAGMYAVQSGWTAYTRGDVAGIRQVWTRSPSGIHRQVSTVGNFATIEALGADGTVVFVSGGKRYYASSSAAPVQLSTALGRTLWRNNRMVILIGRSVFALVP